MNILTRFKSAVSAFQRPQNIAGISSDGNVPATSPWGTNWTGRGTDPNSIAPRFLQDMRPVERNLAIRRSRFIANRLGLGRALIEGSSRYAINEGIIGYASTGDRDFDSSCNRVLDALFEGTGDDSIDITGGHSYYELQEILCPAMMTDGDAGVAKILRRDANGKLTADARPQLQIFATDQIGDQFLTNYVPPDLNTSGSAVWREGILRDSFGKVIAYRVRNEVAPGYPQSFAYAQDFTVFAARDFMLVLDPKRIGINRGLPWTHHGQSSAITMMDLKTLEESAAYLNAFFGAVITTPDGNIPEGLEREVFNKRATKTSEKKTSGETESEIYRKYVNFMGGALIPVLKEGEKLEMVASTRPSLTFTGFMDWLVNDIAWGFGVPPSYVWAIAGRTGPETRLTLAQASWFFRFIMRRMISRFCKPTRDFAIRWGLLTGRINNGRPPRNGASPFLARWRGPRDITIDERYFHKTWLDRLDKGLGTEEEYQTTMGNDAEHIRRQRVEEVADWLELCKARGVPYELVRAPTPGVIIPGTDPNAATAALED